MLPSVSDQKLAVADSVWVSLEETLIAMAGVGAFFFVLYEAGGTVRPDIVYISIAGAIGCRRDTTTTPGWWRGVKRRYYGSWQVLRLQIGRQRRRFPHQSDRHAAIRRQRGIIGKKRLRIGLPGDR